MTGREELVKEATEALSELLSRVDKKSDGAETLRRLIGETGSLRTVYESTKEDLMNLQGLARVPAEAIDLVDDLARCCLRDEMGKRPVIRDYEAAAKYFRAVMYGRKIEYCYLMLLDRRGKMIACRLMQTGTIDRSAVYSREIALCAIRARAVYAVLAHNHPGGNMEPSREDIRITFGIKDALNAVEVVLLDHIIVSDHESVSVRSKGLPPEKTWCSQKKGDKLLFEWLGAKMETQKSKKTNKKLENKE